MTNFNDNSNKFIVLTSDGGLSKMNEEYPLELRRENINQFISNNTNFEGVNLNNLYFAKFCYNKCYGDDIEDQQYADKLTIVYVVGNDETTTIYMDLFKEKLFLSSKYQTPGILYFANPMRNGLSIHNLAKVSDFFKEERLSLEELRCMYDNIKDQNYMYLYRGLDFKELCENKSYFKK